MISHEKIADIRERCDLAEDMLVSHDNYENIAKCYRMLIQIRKDLDIAEEILLKRDKSA